MGLAYHLFPFIQTLVALKIRDSMPGRGSTLDMHKPRRNGCLSLVQLHLELVADELYNLGGARRNNVYYFNFSSASVSVQLN